MELSFVSVGCNRTAHCCAYDASTSLLCYGGNALLALYSIPEHRIVRTLKGHTGRINGVRTQDGIAYTASTDKTIRVWNLQTMECASVLSGHSEAVIAIAVSGKWLASISINGEAFVWDLDTRSIVQKIELGGRRLPVAVALSVPFLAIATTDDTIRLYKLSSSSSSEEGATQSSTPSFEFLTFATGHKDWVRSIDIHVTGNQNDDASFTMVSGSQDGKLRLWVLMSSSSSNTADTATAAAAVTAVPPSGVSSAGMDLDEQEDELLPVIDDEDLVDPIAENPVASIATSYRLVCDSVMRSHEDQVLLVTFNRFLSNPADEVLSVSLDRSIVRWRVQDHVWTPYSRVGEFGGTGGIFSQMGFFGGEYYGKDAYMAYSYTGAFFAYESEVPVHTAATGHADAVNDVCWTDDYLLSVSSDQTTRLYVPLVSKPTSMCEIARPQIHGYGITCIASLGKHAYRFVSGADEKVLRVFDAPTTFLESLRNLTTFSVDQHVLERSQALPKGAAVPELGLTNRPIAASEETYAEAEAEFARPFEPIALTAPPMEDHLLQNTLWPEVAKLYGHANELVSVTVSPNGRWIASSCKAAQAQFAAPILWWVREDGSVTKAATCAPEIQMTVTQSAFSPDSQYLLCATRDRAVAVYHVGRDLQDKLSVASGQASDKIVLPCAVKADKAHDRIVWSCSWHASGAYFATCSRDKTVKIWAFSSLPANSEAGSASCEMKCVCSLTLPSPITSVAFCQHDGLTDRLLIGSEAGGLVVYRVALGDGTSAVVMDKLLESPDRDGHAEGVNRAVWHVNADGSVFAASCSSDWSMRVWKITM